MLRSCKAFITGPLGQFPSRVDVGRANSRPATTAAATEDDPSLWVAFCHSQGGAAHPGSRTGGGCPTVDVGSVLGSHA